MSRRDRVKYGHLLGREIIASINNMLATIATITIDTQVISFFANQKERGLH
ncbi:MAG: hypothetical protein ACTHKP_01310 [Nitrososphaeraceae archaeon]